jgi:hypothetical protein
MIKGSIHVPVGLGKSRKRKRGVELRSDLAPIAFELPPPRNGQELHGGAATYHVLVNMYILYGMTCISSAMYRLGILFTISYDNLTLTRVGSAQPAARRTSHTLFEQHVKRTFDGVNPTRMIHRYIYYCLRSCAARKLSSCTTIRNRLCHNKPLIRDHHEI